MWEVLFIGLFIAFSDLIYGSILTMLYAPAPATNYGASGSLYIGECSCGVNYFARSLLKFDLSSIPPGSTITSAALSLWETVDYAANARTFRVYRLKRAWDEMGATWPNYFNGSTSLWQVPGAAGLNDVEASDIGSRAFAANEPLGEKSWSLNPARVQEWVNGSFTNNGLLIRADVETDDLYIFNASDSPTTTQRPKLVVVYVPPTFTPEAPYTYTSQTDGTTANGNGDTMLINTAPRVNYSTTTYFGVGESNAAANTVYRSVFKFNLSAIPSNAVITSAALSLWAINDYASNTRTFSLYRLKQPWTEGGVTWNTTNGATAWQVAGAAGANDIESAPLASRAFSASESLGTSGEKQWALDPAKVQEWVSGAFTNNGLILRADTESDDMYRFVSGEDATASNRPRLVISYYVPAATATPTATPTATNTPVGSGTFSAQPDGTGGVDTMLYGFAPTSNYGTFTNLYVGEYNSAANAVGRALLKFDLTTIPGNATVTSATLSLWQVGHYSSTDRSLKVYRLNQAWGEATSTWNTHNGATVWQTAGASGGNDAEDAAIGSRLFLTGAIEGNGEKQFALNPAKVQEWVSGAFANNGLIVKAEVELNDMILFASSDYSIASQRPRLVINYYVPTTTPTPSNTPTLTHTPTATSTTAPADLLFANGFESGTLTSWTSSVTDGGDLSVTTAAKLAGSYGMQAVLDDTVSIYVRDDTPAAEARYRARFYFDLNGLTMADNDSFYLLQGYGGSTVVMRLQLLRESGQYKVLAQSLTDASAWVYSSKVVVSDDVHYVEVDWQVSTGAGADNGTLTFYLDGALQDTQTGIDNDTWRIDSARLGAVSSVDADTSGVMYFDAFDSRRTSYIGPAYGAPLPLYTGRGSVTAYIGGSASLPYSYGLSTPYPTPTLQPGNTTSTYSYAAQSATCPDGALPAKPRAVTSVGGDTYCYDKNGNIVKRVEGGTTYTQTFDIENRLASVTVGGVTTSFVYDGDGALIKKVKGTATTHYVGAYEVELNNSVVTKKTTYYGPAMRVDVVGGSNTVYYMLSDHLGSASVLLKPDGTIEANGDQQYYPFGESRVPTADLKTAHLFTGQHAMGSELGGIYRFGARFYSPRLSRFLSADTVVPYPRNYLQTVEFM
jgi:RHS repeat-associated protein